MNKAATLIAATTLALSAFAQAPRQANPEAKLHRFSTTIEKERPELNQETKDLIAAYRRDPSDANRAALRRQVAANYDAVVARKKAKLAELKLTAVDAFAKTKGACGGVDFWGNCWEWTSTVRGDDANAVKGGAFDSKRTDCRTEARSESRKAGEGYPNVTFRVVREDCE